MTSSNYQKTYTPVNNAVVFEALSQEGRIQLTGSGTITVEVSVDGVNFSTVEHELTFSSGVAIAPFRFIIGDFVRISATTLTAVAVNFNDVRRQERN